MPNPFDVVNEEKLARTLIDEAKAKLLPELPAVLSEAVKLAIVGRTITVTKWIPFTVRID